MSGAAEGRSPEMAHTANEHGSDFRRFLRGEWTRCRCGYDPRDNQKLNEHFAEHGFREVDDHGQIVRKPVSS